MSKRKKDKQRRRSRRQRAPASQKQFVHAAAQAGFPPSRPEGSELLLLNFELHGEPVNRHSPAVEPLAQEAVAALHSADGVRAERLLKQALELEPDQLALLNNLASAYLCQGRFQEAEALIRDMHARHPDYLFGRVNMSHIYVREGRLDQAAPAFEKLKKELSVLRQNLTELAK